MYIFIYLIMYRSANLHTQNDLLMNTLLEFYNNPHNIHIMMNIKNNETWNKSTADEPLMNGLINTIENKHYAVKLIFDIFQKKKRPHFSKMDIFKMSNFGKSQHKFILCFY